MQTDTHAVVMHHLKVNTRGTRGVPVTYRALPWSKANRGFMEDRATLTAALATFAFRQKIAGNQAAVDRVATRWASFDTLRRYGAGGTGKERREGAQLLIENDVSQLEQLKTESGASNAYLDHRMLRQQVASTFGVTEPNLTGDPSVSNLASIKEMSGPEYKMYNSWQQLWTDEYSDIFDFVIKIAQALNKLAKDADLTYEIDFPLVVLSDLGVVVSAISQLISAQAVSGEIYVPADRISLWLLNAFGEDDLDLVLDELKALRNELAAQIATGELSPESINYVAEVLQGISKVARRSNGDN